MRQMKRDMLRAALAVLLSVSMTWSGGPVAAVRALAEEAAEATGQADPAAAGEFEAPATAGGDEDPEPGEGADATEGEDAEANPEAGPEAGPEDAAPGGGSSSEQPDAAETSEEPEEDQATDEATARATSPRRAPVRNPSDTTVSTVSNSTYGITMNLFDYDALDAAQWRTGNVNNYDNPKLTGINTNSTDKSTQLQFYANGTLGTGINNFAGNGSSDYSQQYAMQGIVKSTLSGSTSDDPSTRFPVVNTSSNQNLSYLFDPNTKATGVKAAYKGVDGLFYIKDNMLTFDSNEHYADFDEATKTFTVYEDTYFRYSGSKDMTSTMPVGFFPFDDFKGNTMKDGVCINPTQDEWDVKKHVNHSFGMTMQVDITMPYEGELRTPEGDLVPMVFEFSGDDDMWVFIDGQLVLDVGGIHQPVHGSIDFSTGKIELSSGTRIPVIQGSYAKTASGISDASVALGTTAYLWSGSNPNTGAYKSVFDTSQWRAGTEHTVQVFYLERGGCDSNLELSTNIHLAAKRGAAVTKQWANGSVPGSDATVDVQLIRKAVPRNNPSGTPVYTKLDTKTLSAGTDWTAAWSGLLRDGYIDDTDTYYDFTYLVREVPLEGYSPVYSSGDDDDMSARPLTAEEVGEEFAGAYVVMDGAFTPIKITNVPSYLDVRKDWVANEDGSGTDAHAHDADAVYVQLYRQALVPASGDVAEHWGAAEPVGSPQALTAAVDATTGAAWSHRFGLTETGPDVRYFVKEGTLETPAGGGAAVFVPSDALMAGKADASDEGLSYAWVSTAYTAKEATVGVSDNTAIWADGAKTTESAAANKAAGVAYADLTAMAAGTTVTVPRHGSASAVISNRPDLRTDVRLVKADADDATALAGAAFKLYKDDGTEGYQPATDNVPFEEDNPSYTTGADGTVLVEGLVPGTYWLVEVTAPVGYLLRDARYPVQVSVSDRGVVTVAGNDAYDSAKTKPTVGSKEGGAYPVTVLNVRTYDLPSTGGPGAYPFLLAGAFACGLVADEARRRRARG